VTFTYFCYGWCLWLLFFKNSYHLEIKSSAIFSMGVFLAGVVGDTLGGVISDQILRATGNVRLARLAVIMLGFAGAALSLLSMLFSHDIQVVALSLSGGFFFAELVIGPMWSIPMDIAPKFAGTAAGIMNMGSALAAIVSPLVAGYVIDLTGNWYLPFLMTMGLLALGGLSALLMHPEQPLEAV
jgi:MFS family permease